MGVAADAVQAEAVQRREHGLGQVRHGRRLATQGPLAPAGVEESSHGRLRVRGLLKQPTARAARLPSYVDAAEKSFARRAGKGDGNYVSRKGGRGLGKHL